MQQHAKPLTACAPAGRRGTHDMRFPDTCRSYRKQTVRGRNASGGGGLDLPAFMPTGLACTTRSVWREKDAPMRRDLYPPADHRCSGITLASSPAGYSERIEISQYDFACAGCTCDGDRTPGTTASAHEDPHAAGLHLKRFLSAMRKPSPSVLWPHNLPIGQELDRIDRSCYTACRIGQSSTPRNATSFSGTVRLTPANPSLPMVRKASMRCIGRHIKGQVERIEPQRLEGCIVHDRG
jgi:hypothetical protein